jgi:L-threonylcarbamoyladenylate synthase
MEASRTQHLVVDPARLNAAESAHALDRAAELLRAGGLVALPTETVYGLGANALDRQAVEHIFAAKQRPSWDPIIVHIADIAMLDALVAPGALTAAVRQLIDAFWPGPLTLLLPRSAQVPDAVTAGRPLVGIRMPAHSVALELIRRAGVPVAAPSANLFGHISPTTAAHVLADLDGRIDAVVDAGPTGYGVESTVLDPSTSPMTIYRPGAVTLDQIREVAGPVEIYKESARLTSEPAEALPSPGVGLRHYAPRARLILVEASESELAKRLADEVLSYAGERVGVMLPEGVGPVQGLAGTSIFPWGRWDSPDEMARMLYSALRSLDAEGCQVILCPLPPAGGIGAAIRDRLRKAARR